MKEKIKKIIFHFVNDNYKVLRFFYDLDSEGVPQFVRKYARRLTDFVEDYYYDNLYAQEERPCDEDAEEIVSKFCAPDWSEVEA